MELRIIANDSSQVVMDVKDLMYLRELIDCASGYIPDEVEDNLVEDMENASSEIGQFLDERTV